MLVSFTHKIDAQLIRIDGLISFHYKQGTDQNLNLKCPKSSSEI